MWENIETNNLIQAETEKAVLIKIPKEEWLFWHPKKLVKTFGKNNYRMSFGVCDDMKFKIFKNGKGKWNKFEKISEKEISIEELKKYFKNSCKHFNE